MADRKLIVEIVGDSKSVEAAFARSSRSAQKFGRQVDATGAQVKLAVASFGSLAKVAGVTFGGALIAQGFRDSLSAASDLHEQVSKVGQVFKDSAGETVAWSKTTADAFGVSQRAALTAAGTFGNLFNTIGLAPSRAAAMSRSLVQLAADLASFNNASPEEALDAIRSGLIGEAEPLRRFGVLLSEARVQQEAMAETGKTTAKSLTDQEKALARYTLILRDTAPAQGDFARTSDGAANASRRLSANVDDLQANLAAGLLPVLAKVTGGLADLTASMQATQITAGQLASDKGLRNKIADAFGVDELFKLLNAKPSAGLVSRPDEGAAKFIGRTAKQRQAALEAALKQVLGPIKRITELAKGELATAMQKQFDTILDALDLKLDKAKLTRGTHDDLRVLAEIERTINLRIQSEGRTTSLLRALFQVQQERQAILDSIAQEKAQASQDKIDKMFAGLQLNVDKAGLTKRLDDDLAALVTLRDALKRQIAAGGDVVQFQSQLVTVTGQIADKRAEIAAKLNAGVQARQFKALGFDATGGDLVPTADNLRKQLAQLTKRLDESGKGLSSKLQSQLAGVRKVLSGQLGTATDETRAKIRDLFQTIRSTLDQESGKPLKTNRNVQLSDKILAALGFGQDPDVTSRLKLRTSTITATPTVRVPTAVTATTGGGVTITGPITVVADNPDAFLRELQKRSLRTSATSRGRFPGRSLGLA